MKDTLKLNKEFNFLYRKGKSIVSPCVVTYYYKNRYNKNKYGITAGKKVGNAVKRNRARRIIRESFLSLNKDLKQGYNFVFVARGKTPFVKSTDIYKQLKWQFNKEKLFEK